MLSHIFTIEGIPLGNNFGRHLEEKNTLAKKKFATGLLSQLLFEVLHVPEAIIEVVVVLNANTFVFLCDLLG